MIPLLRFTALALACSLLCGCTAAAPAPTVSTDPPAASSGDPLVAQPQYPQVAAYPMEEDFIDAVTGEFDDDGYMQAYNLWRDGMRQNPSLAQQQMQTLTPYFSRCIPEFLSTSDENTVCSPANIYMALAMLAECTGGTSRQELLTLLNAGPIEDLRTQAQQVWRSHYRADGASTCILANSLWLENGLPFREEITGRLARDYYASVFQGDLGSEEVNQLLRSWINDQTGGLLQEQSQNLTLDPQTILALASTIYYRAKWTDEFWPDNNTDGIFHAPGGDLPAEFMNRTLSYGPYYWGDNFGAVSLSLEDGSKMWLILPDEGTTPADILSGGQAIRLTLGNWQESGQQKSLRINLSLPKFDVSSDLKLKDALNRLEIHGVFDPETADFSALIPDTAAWLDTVNHAARVKVDEEGVEAAAYTVMAVCGAGAPPEEEMDFILDRPFLFVISSRYDLPLFCGVVNTP